MTVMKVNVTRFLVLYMLGSSTGGSKVTDEVYMEVVVGGEEPVTHDRSYDSVSLSKDFMPVAWAAAYGQHPSIKLLLKLEAVHQASLSVSLSFYRSRLVLLLS